MRVARLLVECLLTDSKFEQDILWSHLNERLLLAARAATAAGVTSSSSPSTASQHTRLGEWVVPLDLEKKK